MTVHDAESLVGFFSGSQMKHILNEAVHVARVLLKVESSIIFLLASRSSVHSTAWDGREPAEHTLSLDSPYVKALWEGRRSITWHQRDRCADPQVAAVLDAMNLDSGLIMPVIIEGQMCGLWMVAASSGRSFSDSDESILQALRENIALTIGSIILSEENARLQREANALYEIGKEISQLMDLNKVLKMIVEKTCSLMGAEMSYLALADSEHQEIRVAITEGTRAGELRKMVLKYGEGVGGAVATTRYPELIPSYPKDPRPKSPLVAAQAASEGIESIISVPMVTRRGLIGVLFAASRRENVFNSSQMDYLAALGTQAAIAIENARLYEQEKITSEALRASMVTSEQLLRLVLRNQGMQAIADTLSELVNEPVAVEDTRHHCLCFSNPAHGRLDASMAGQAGASQGSVTLSSADIWSDPELEDQVHALRDLRQATHIPARPQRGPGYSRLIVPVASGDDLRGYIIARESSGPMDGQRQSAVVQASIVMALEFLKQEVAQSVEQRLAGDFLDDVINGRCTDESADIPRAARQNVNLHASHLVMVLDVDRFSEEITRHHWSDRDALLIKRRILTVVSECAHRERRGSLAGMQSDSALLLLPAGGREDACADLEFGRQLQASLQESLPYLSISIGIGRAVEDYTEIPRSYQEAQVALFTAASSGRRGNVIAYKDLGVLPLLLQSRSQSDLEAFMHRHLDPLIDHDARKRSEMLPTLKSYLANNGHLQKTAAECSIHINTLKYRIQRMEELLGLDLMDGENRFNLHLALSIHNMHQILEKNH